MMSSHLALPQKGHLDQVLDIFGFLCKYHNTEFLYDLNNAVVDENELELCYWSLSEFGHIQGQEEKHPTCHNHEGRASP